MLKESEILKLILGYLETSEENQLMAELALPAQLEAIRDRED